MDLLDRLYELNNILTAAGKDKIAEHEKEYLEILQCAKGTPNDKRLASRFIAKFFKDFPAHVEQSIDTVTDLCEDGDVAIRKQAIHDMPNFCKPDAPGFSGKRVESMADVLTQLLMAEDTTELQVIHSALLAIMKVDIKSTLRGIFGQILSPEVTDVVRERAIKFIAARLNFSVLDKEAEELLFELCGKVMQDATGDEFCLLMGLLGNLKMAKLISGQQKLVQMAVTEAEIDKADASEECLNKMIACVRLISSYFSPFVPSWPFVRCFCLSVLPVLPDGDRSLDILKLLAELAPHALKPNEEDETLISELKQCQTVVFDKLLDFTPPPLIAEENGHENLDLTPLPTLQLTHIECLMLAFYQLSKRSAPSFLLDDADKLKDFRTRLQYLARGLQNQTKQLESATVVGDKKETDQKVQLALKTTSNIQSFIKELFRNPPSFKLSMTPSWQQSATAKRKTSVSGAVGGGDDVTSASGKRKPIVFESDNKNGGAQAVATTPNRNGRRDNRAVYAPPGGKFSSNIGSAPSYGGFGRGGRGGFRGKRGGGGGGYRY